jgi:hypothetical protein
MKHPGLIFTIAVVLVVAAVIIGYTQSNKTGLKS